MSQLAELIQQIDELKKEIESLRPIRWEQEQRVMQKFRLDWNYHSNAIEGNSLTYGETKAFLLHGITAQGKPFRDYLDIKGHQAAIEYLQEFIRGNEPLTEVHIRELHKILLIESYEMDAVTHDGHPTKRRIEVGRYKSAPNSVKTSTGELHVYASPEETPAKMGDLIRWYRDEIKKGETHPLLLAAFFHLRFVQIHPFDDGNGRMSRLLMNLILMQNGYVPVIINTNSKPEYLLALEKADSGDEDSFIELIATNLVYSLDLFIRGAKGENIEGLGDLDKRLRLLQKQLTSQGIITSAPKNIERQATLFAEFIKPLFIKLSDVLRQIEPLVYKTESTIKYRSEQSNHKIDSQTICEQVDFPTDCIEALSTVMSSDSRIRLIELENKIIYSYSIESIPDMEEEYIPPVFDLQTIHIGLDKYQFTVAFGHVDHTKEPGMWEASGIWGNSYERDDIVVPWVDLYSHLYGDSYPDEEISSLVSKILTPIIERLEKKFKEDTEIPF